MFTDFDMQSVASMDQAFIDREDVRREGLVKFTELAWPIIEPATPFIHNWHLDVMAEYLEAVWKCEVNDLLINMPPRHMKLVRHAEPVLTPKGWRSHGDLSVGDEVYSVDGRTTKILRVSQEGVADAVITFTNGEKIHCNGDHLWTVYDRACARWRTVQTSVLAATRYWSGERSRFQLPSVSAVQFDTIELPLDPYILGLWLGDGTTGKPTITHDQDDVAHIDYMQAHGFRISNEYRHGRTIQSDFYGTPFVSLLRTVGVFREKHIPNLYKFSSEDHRIKLMAGLLDTDGYTDEHGRVRWCTSSERLASDIQEVLTTLGWKPYRLTSETPGYGEYRGGKPHFQIGCQPKKPLPVQLERKRVHRLDSVERRIGIRSIEQLSHPEPGHCITVDRPDGLYLVGRSCIPTHNSIEVAVMYPAWVWTVEPSLRWLYSSYAQSLSIRDSVKMRRLIESPWYRARWGHVFELTSDQNQKLKFENDKSGYRMATSVGGSNTGEGGDIIVVDDPHNVEQRESDVMREGAIDWWSNVMSTRINNPKKRRRIVVMQRVHEHDLSGHILSQGGWHHLNLPAEYEGGKCVVNDCVFHWSGDKRTVEGEPLWNARYGKAEIQQLKKDLKEYGAAAQLQQRPAPAEGGILKRHWWRYWCYPGQEETLPPVRMKNPLDGEYLEIKPVPLPYAFDKEVQSWDMAFKDLAESSYVVGEQWGRKGPNSYLKDQIRAQMDFTATLDAVRSFNRTHKAAGEKIIEDKANGPAILSVLKQEIPGMSAHPVKGDKQARASAYAHLVRDGNVFLPHPSIAPWVEEFIHECATFPNANYDDQVDTWSQAMDKLYKTEDPGLAITPEYHTQYHLAQHAMEPVQGIRSFRFWFQGMYPCCVIGQILSKEGIVLLDCLLGEQNSGLEDLIQTRVIPTMAADYRGCTDWRDITNHPPLSKLSDQTEHHMDQVLVRLLQASPEPGEPDFFTRLNAIKGLLRQTGRLKVNPAPTPGEREPWIHLALSGGYAFRQDQSGQVSKTEARKFHPLTSVGEAIGHGLARLYLHTPPPPVKTDRMKAMRRAGSYAVR